MKSRPLLRGTLAAALLVTAASSAGALPRGVTDGAERRGHHGVPARERASRTAVPRCVEEDDHGQRDLSGGIPERGLRRDGNGPPSRASPVQGHRAASEPHRRDESAVLCHERNDVLRPDQLLRDVSGVAGDPRVGPRHGGRPHGGLPHREERSRQRDERRTKRVRARREPSDERPVPAHDEHGVPVAQLWEFADRSSGRHRERSDRAAAGLLPNLLPARQRGPAGGGKVRSRPRPSPRSRRPSDPFAAPSAGSSRRTPWSRPRMASGV